MIGFVAMTYVQLNEQVTLQNQDPVKAFTAGLKPSVIDLEALTNLDERDKGQGQIRIIVLKDKDASAN